jgi:hypothetical protein
MKPALTPRERRLLANCRSDWPRFARDILGVYLDPDQEAIVRSAQLNKRTCVRSGHARGKDFTMAVCALCHIFSYFPSKTILTAPTDRQVKNVMIPEMVKIWRNAKIPLGGYFTQHEWRYGSEFPEWFCIGFKAADNAPEGWTGFHSPHVMVNVTEASGLPDETFNAIEGLLTGDSRIVLALNPHRTAGEAYNAFRSPLYTKFVLSGLNAPNVLAGKVIIPGQVDRDWVSAVMQKPGWVSPVTPGDHRPEEGDFEWDLGDGKGKRWFRPGDLFRVRVMGEWPTEPEGQLIPLAWVEAAVERWKEWESQGKPIGGDALRLGVDVAGMGVDNTCYCHRYGDVVTLLEAFGKSDHMATAGRVKQILDSSPDSHAFVDTIGEGAGVHSRLSEQGAESESVKFSESAKGLRDLTDEREFDNLRAYCWWAIRDALDPKLGGKLALPPNDELVQDLTSPQYTMTSQGKIRLEKKEDIKARLGRSPDYGDALALTYAPEIKVEVHGGAFAGVGVWGT